MKRLCLVIISALILISCGGPPQVDTKPMTFFEGRVVVDVIERVSGARPNDRPEYLNFRFTDIGDYKVSFSTEHSCSDNAWWKCPRDFNVSISSGAREISQKFDSLLGLVPSFTIKVERNGQSETCNYSTLSTRNNCN